MNNSKDCPYVINQAKTLAVVADGHRLLVVVNGDVFIVDNPNNPPPHITLPTVPVSMSNTPDDLMGRLGVATPETSTPNLKLFQVSVFSEDCGPGSSPTVETFIFSSEEKRSAFIQDWVAEQKDFGHERRDGDEYRFSGNKDWTYWLETGETEIDCSYYYGKVWKRY